jgi:hypothetical protein
MPYWLDWMRRDTRFPLPADIGRMLSTEAEVRAALAEGSDPIAVSTDKWRRIGEVIRLIGSTPLPLAYMHDLARHIGSQTCALCIDSAARYEAAHGEPRYGTDKCSVCPLASVDRCTRKGSVYQRLEALMLESPLDVLCGTEAARLEEISSLQRAMQDNLESLAVEVGVGSG